jgi:hypothetical protein
MPSCTITFQEDCQIQVSSPGRAGAVSVMFRRGECVEGVIRPCVIQTLAGPVDGAAIQCEDGRVLLDVNLDSVRITDVGEDTMAEMDAGSVKEIDANGQTDDRCAGWSELSQTPVVAPHASESGPGLLPWLLSFLRMDHRCICGEPCSDIYCEDCRETYPHGTEPKVRYRRALTVNELEAWQVND